MRKGFLYTILVVLLFLTGCNTIDRINNEKQEQKCLPGTQCWNSLPSKSQQMKRQEMMRKTQEHQMWQQNSHSSGLWAIQSQR